MRSRFSARIWPIALAFATVVVSRPAAADDQQECLQGSKDASAETIAACTRAIESGNYSDQDLAGLYHARGYRWSSTRFADRTERAFKDFSEAIRANPKSGGSLLNRAHIYNQWHDYDRAIADVDQAFEAGLADYGKQVGFGERGYAYRAKADNDRAIANYTAGIQLNAKNYVALTARCNAYLAKRDFDHAIADCSQAIAFCPDHKDAYFNRSYAYQAKGDLDRAVADYDRMIALDPQDKDARASRATAYLRKGDVRRAIADFGPERVLAWIAAIVAFLTGVVWLCCRAGTHARGRWSGPAMIEIFERELVELQGRNGALERIAAALEKHSSG